MTKSVAVNKARNFSVLLLDQFALNFLFFLWDVVVCLSATSEVFQRRDATVADVYAEIGTAKIAPLNLKEQ